MADTAQALVDLCVRQLEVSVQVVPVRGEGGRRKGIPGLLVVEHPSSGIGQGGHVGSTVRHP